MQRSVYTDRFETVLPKGRFFNSPPVKQKTTNWQALAITAIAAATFIVVVRQSNPPTTVPVTAPTTVFPTVAPLPDPKPIHEQVLAPVTPSVPRAQLVHVRPIGTYEYLRMPDGRVLMTHYMGELANTMRLPTRGAQLGDMWYTRADQHSWVLAPLSTGSQSIGWIDP
jgi:hypothetical protein